MLSSAVLGVVLVFAPASSRADDLPKAIPGTWVVESVEFNGEKVADLAQKLQFTFDKTTMKLGGVEEILKDYASIQYKLDATVTPPLIDLTVVQGAQKDAKLEGIIEVKGDTMRLCVKVVGNERPLKFESPENANIALVTLKREKN